LGGGGREVSLPRGYYGPPLQLVVQVLLPKDLPFLMLGRKISLAVLGGLIFASLFFLFMTVSPSFWLETPKFPFNFIDQILKSIYNALING